MPHFERNLETKALRMRFFIAGWLWLVLLIAMLFSYRDLPTWAKITGTVVLVIFAPAGIGALAYKRRADESQKD